jgi:phosphoglucosamine mutase
MQKIYFGTDGIRGNADKFPFTDETIFKLGKAIAKWSIQKYKTSSPRLLIGHDTRISCSRIKQFLEDGLHSQGAKITDAGVIPTPAVLQLIQSFDQPLSKDFNFGIVISASHNPYTDNGIKILDAKTGKLSHNDEEIIVKYFNELSSEKEQTKHYSLTTWQNAIQTYEQNILEHFKPNFLKGLTIVLDCAHGATYKIAPEIFKKLGANVITFSNNPDGKNINYKCGALHPELIQQEIVNNNADIGFAFDGDGDRVIAANKNSILKDGDDLLAILLSHPSYQNETHIVGTVMTNHGINKYLETKNVKLERTKVGDKYVCSALKKNNWVLGGETSGHIIIRTYLNTGDGIFIALKTIEAMVLTNNIKMETFEKYPQILLNIPVTQKHPLDQEPYKSIIKNQEKKLENGRIVTRYSGTENLLRIMVEDCQNHSANNIAQELAQSLQNALCNA